MADRRTAAGALFARLCTWHENAYTGYQDGTRNNPSFLLVAVVVVLLCLLWLFGDCRVNQEWDQTILVRQGLDEANFAHGAPDWKSRMLLNI